jgi:hypothetical protein
MVAPLEPREEAGGNLLLAAAAEEVLKVEGRDAGLVITKEATKEAITGRDRR